MTILKKIKYVFSQTRLPYVFLVILIGFGLWYMVGSINRANVKINRELNQQRTVHITEMNNSQHEIFKNRAQLNALSDEHNADLMQSMFNRMMRMQKQKHPKALTANPKYMYMTSQMMQIDDRDNNRINSLQHHISHLRRQIKFEHNHDSFTNLINHGSTNAYKPLIQNSIGFGIFTIVELAMITYVFKFKGIQIKKWQQAIDDKKRKRYIAEYGDDEGFKANDESDDN